MDKRQEHFDERLKALSRFKKKTGRWPSSTSPDHFERSLGVWCKKIRQSHIKGKLNQARRDALEQIQFQLSPSKDMYATLLRKLVAFIKRNKRLPASNEKLYAFSRRQYKEFTNLSHEAQKLLSAVNFVELWKCFERDGEKSWQQHFKELESFVNEYGRLPTRKTNPNLEYWVTNQRRAIKKGELSKERKMRFDDAGIDLFERSFAASENNWHQRCLQLRKFIDEHKRIPRRTDHLTPERSLYNWLANQKAYIKNGKLSSEQVKKFQSLQIVSERNLAYRDARLVRTLAQLVQFKKAKGRWPLPSSNGKEKALYVWCARKRRDFNNGRLRENELKAFQEIGLSFENKSQVDYIAELKKYIKVHYRFPPSTHRLYKYFCKRKFVFEKMDDELKQLLNAIGFFTRKKRGRLTHNS